MPNTVLSVHTQSEEARQRLIELKPVIEAHLRCALPYFSIPQRTDIKAVAEDAVAGSEVVPGMIYTAEVFNQKQSLKMTWSTYIQQYLVGEHQLPHFTVSSSIEGTASVPSVPSDFQSSEWPVFRSIVGFETSSSETRSRLLELRPAIERHMRQLVQSFEVDTEAETGFPEMDEISEMKYVVECRAEEKRPRWMGYLRTYLMGQEDVWGKLEPLIISEFFL